MTGPARREADTRTTSADLGLPTLAVEPAAAEAAADGELRPWSRVGPYRIEALLGRGGMGEVYRAEQLEPVRRRAALKLLPGLSSAERIAWFAVETQLLARMAHPAIAQVYDAGSTADGRYWFAMEYVRGTPLTAYCDQHGLALAQRIELVARACLGVQHAHQKGVIHRDLKPDNILVTEVDGQALPKIIDFGVALSEGGSAQRGVAPDRGHTGLYESRAAGAGCERHRPAQRRLRAGHRAV